MENTIKILNEKCEKLTSDKKRIIKEFHIYGQTLVNEGLLEIGTEPYLCEYCETVTSSISPFFETDNICKYICNNCHKLTN